jgi:hypothetical protein
MAAKLRTEATSRGGEFGLVNDRNYSEQVVLRISPELRDAITRAALDEDRTLASMTRRLMQRAVSDYQHEQAPA